MTTRRWFALDLAVKGGLVGLLVFAVARPDLPQFDGKAMTGRAVAYPLAVTVVPAVWWLAGRRRRYPFDVDVLLALPFLVDVAGNAGNLYDTISWWDDANHLVNWAILSLGIGLLLARTSLSPPVVAGLTVGFAAFTAIVWELLEYVTFIRNSPERATAYTDTLGDLTLGTSGSLVAAAVAAAVAVARERAATAGSR